MYPEDIVEKKIKLPTNPTKKWFTKPNLRQKNPKIKED